MAKLQNSEWVGSMRLQMSPLEGTSFESQRGKLRIGSGRPLDVEVRDFEGDGSHVFTRRKESLMRLLRMQRWPGVSRVFTACLLTRRQRNACSSAGSPVYFIR